MKRNKETIKVTVNQLVTILKNLPNSIGSLAHIKQVTEPKLLMKDRVTKEPNPFTKVLKISTLSILVSTDYAKGVENQLVKEGKDRNEYNRGVNTMPLNFTNSQNTFVGEFIDSQGVNKGFVIQYRPHEKSHAKTHYIVDNERVMLKSELPDILPISQPAKNQGTEREVLWRKLYVKNIKRINIYNLRLEVID